MKIYNTLGRKLEEFKPISNDLVKVYSCGPTVYDHVQIGNLRTYIFDDILRRTLKASGYRVQHVMNITDVDDKTILRSRKKYPDEEPKTALAKLTGRYEELFYKDARKLGIDLDNTQIAKATEHIPEMQALINKIPNKYISDDGVYFDINQDPGYGALVNLDQSHKHHRINNDEYDKEHVADFALWKKHHGSEPAWDFDVEGRNVSGRPGWHIECSAMSTKYLGQPFDIHTGGVDLIFPHHENEIAQSRLASGKALANYFVHGEHLLVDGKKMSKSLNNFYTLGDLEDKGFEPMTFRLLVLQAHYRSQLNFGWASLSAAAQALSDLQAWADLSHQREAKYNAELTGRIIEALQTDLNTPTALAILMKSTAQTVPNQKLLERLDSLLGLSLSGRADITGSQKKLIKDRESARQSKDWQLADKIRNDLAGQGVELEDATDGPLWQRA